MRPLVLKMTAFGSYAEETTIPFADLRHGLYLVTGDTGAGKTTIFDAIMFALYGRASGSDRGANADMLHSDYVPKSVDTVVELRFLQNNGEYTVARRIHFPKKRDGSGGYGEAGVEAELREPNQPPMNGSTKVTKRCEELLGLNADQFRKIIMLAQGEFNEFLKADTDKKSEILRKLFDSSPYLWFQNLICAARNELKKRRSEQEEGLQSLMKTVFQAPAGMSDEERLLYAPFHPELISNLSALIDGEADRLSAVKESLARMQQGIDALNEKKGAAESVNRQLADLEAAMAHKDELEARQADVNRRKAVMERAESALHKAKPAIADFEKADAEWRSTRSKIEQLKADLEVQRKVLEDAKADAAGDEAAQEAVNGLAVELQRIEEQLPLYDQRDAKEREGATAEQEAEREAAAEKAVDLEKQRLEGEIRAMNDRLATLDKIDAQVLAAENAHEESRRRLDALAGEAGIRRAVASVRQQEQALDEARKALLGDARVAAEAANRYNHLYQRFIAGQAGLLAAELRQRVANDGEASCPVCGSTVCRAQLINLPMPDEETPGKEMVDRAKKEAYDLEKKRADQDAVVEKMKAMLQGEKARIVDNASRWLADCRDWENLCAENYLDVAIEDARVEAARAADALKQLCRQREARDAMKAKLPGKEAELRQCDEDIKGHHDMALRRAADVKRLKAEVDGYRLPYQDRAAAEAAKCGLLTERNRLAEQIKRHREAQVAAQARLDKSEGSRGELQKAIEAQEAKRGRAFDGMNMALRQADFSDVDDVAKALAPIGDRDGEDWLKAERKTQLDHEYDQRNTREQIEGLTAQTAGKRHVDLDALQSAIDAARAEWAETDSIRSEQESLLKNHRDVLGRAEAAKQSLLGAEAAWQRIDRLANLAAGASGADGKISFERYVLAAVFKDILEMANRRLDRMSGGRYELVLKENGAARANAKAGLDVEVLDYSTNKRRPSGSLSGGEAFFTSLSLALGLSDVVQNHAGGRRIDALFIDEGFGSLSDDYLDKALEVLNQLTEGNRLVGIISHVDKLGESIPQKIHVRNDGNGSRIDPLL